MNWNAFWSGLLGTAVPALGVSVIMLILTFRINKALEAHRNKLAEKLSLLKSDLDKRHSERPAQPSPQSAVAVVRSALNSAVCLSCPL
jgi:hypothetical protein